MLDGETKNNSYELHLLGSNIQSDNIRFNIPDYQETFRYKPLAEKLINRQQNTSTYTAYAQIDRMSVKINFTSFDVRVGRQAITWGAGRFWQPTDVFGAFNANELIRDYKPGIDAINLGYYPDDFSSINLVYTFSENEKTNVGFRYTRPAGEKLYLSAIFAQVLKNKMIGGSLETDWHDAGLWLEAVISNADNKNQILTVAGIDYRLSNEWLITAEVYYNTLGARQVSDFSQVISNKLSQAGLLKQMSRQLIGVSLQKNITPLININYLWINAILFDEDIQSSSLHQLAMTYSISNESELWFTLLSTTGKNVDEYGIPQSEFGHIPYAASFLVRIYF